MSDPLITSVAEAYPDSTKLDSMATDAAVKAIFGESDSDEDDEEDFQKEEEGEADDSGSKVLATRVTTPPPPSKKRRRLMQKKKKVVEQRTEGTAYDSGDELEETAEDTAFIDTDGDDHELLAEYARETQQFTDEPGGEDDFEQRDAETQQDKVKNPMDEALQRMRKKKTKEMSTDEKDKVVVQFLERMSDAAMKDALARREGRPGLHKLQMLETVQRMLAQRTLHNTLLDFDALVAVAEWLTPNEDGSPPALALRTGLLAALQPLPAAPEHLKKSNIGRIVMKLSRDHKEMTEVRRLARQLIEQWARPVVGRGTNYRGLEAQQEQELGVSIKGVVSRLDTRKDDADDLIASLNQRNEASARVRVPRFRGFDFVIRPQSQTDPQSPSPRRKATAFKPDTAKGRLAKKVISRGRTR